MKSRRYFAISVLLVLIFKLHHWSQNPTHQENALNNAHVQTTAAFAIIVPFTSWESEVLLRNFELWNIYTPCTSNNLAQTDLIFYFHKDLTKASGHLVPMFRKRIAKYDQVSRCFNSIKFLNADLSESDDLYPESTARMFFKLFTFSKIITYQSFFYMEADVFPCQKGWIDALLYESRIHGSFWVRGSIIKGSNEETGQYSYANHINGNALYAVGNAKFRSFLKDVIEPNFWKDSDSYLGGYDVAIYMIRLDRLLVSWKFYTETIHLFQYTNIIQNYYREPVNITNVCKSSPETFLVHGRKAFY